MKTNNSGQSQQVGSFSNDKIKLDKAVSDVKRMADGFQNSRSVSLEGNVVTEFNNNSVSEHGNEILESVGRELSFMNSDLIDGKVKVLQTSTNHDALKVTAEILDENLSGAGELLDAMPSKKTDVLSSKQRKKIKKGWHKQLSKSSPRKSRRSFFGRSRQRTETQAERDLKLNAQAEVQQLGEVTYDMLDKKMDQAIEAAELQFRDFMQTQNELQDILKSLEDGPIEFLDIETINNCVDNIPDYLKKSNETINNFSIYLKNILNNKTLPLSEELSDTFLTQFKKASDTVTSFVTDRDVQFFKLCLNDVVQNPTDIMKGLGLSDVPSFNDLDIEDVSVGVGNLVDTSTDTLAVASEATSSAFGGLQLPEISNIHIPEINVPCPSAEDVCSVLGTGGEIVISGIGSICEVTANGLECVGEVLTSEECVNLLCCPCMILQFVQDL